MSNPDSYITHSRAGHTVSPQRGSPLTSDENLLPNSTSSNSEVSFGAARLPVKMVPCEDIRPIQTGMRERLEGSRKRRITDASFSGPAAKQIHTDKSEAEKNDSDSRIERLTKENGELKTRLNMMYNTLHLTSSEIASPRALGQRLETMVENEKAQMSNNGLLVKLFHNPLQPVSQSAIARLANSEGRVVEFPYTITLQYDPAQQQVNRSAFQPAFPPPVPQVSRSYPQYAPGSSVMPGYSSRMAAFPPPLSHYQPGIDACVRPFFPPDPYN